MRIVKLTCDEQHILAVLAEKPNRFIITRAWFWSKQKAEKKALNIVYSGARVVEGVPTWQGDSLKYGEVFYTIHEILEKPIITVSEEQLKRLFKASKIVLEVVWDDDSINYIWKLNKEEAQYVKPARF